MERKKYQVFISSTYTDLINERNAVTQCLLDNDCIPVGMEQFPASNMSQMDYIKKMLDDCDYYVLILAGRYGSVDDSGISYTEKEYDYAVSCGIPIMSFVVKDIGTLKVDQCERDKKLADKLVKFRKKVCSGKMVKFYSNADELRGHVAAAIYRCIRDFPARGWIRGPKSDSATKRDTVGRLDTVINNHSSNTDDKYTIPVHWTKEELLVLLKHLYSSIIDCASGLNNGITEKTNEALNNIQEYVGILYVQTDVYYDPESIERKVSIEIIDLYNSFVEAFSEAKRRETEDKNSSYVDALKLTDIAFNDLRRSVATAIRKLDN